MQTWRVVLCSGLCLLFSACTSSELQVTSVEPSGGTVSGGERVVLHGSGFSAGQTSCSVRFGKVEAGNVTILSADKIQVTTPSGSPGPADVEVTFDNGRTFQLKGAFAYKQPDQSKTRDVFLSGTPKPGEAAQPGTPAPMAGTPAPMAGTPAPAAKP